jgi:hypothetical protein
MLFAAVQEQGIGTTQTNSELDRPSDYVSTPNCSAVR